MWAEYWLYITYLSGCVMGVFVAWVYTCIQAPARPHPRLKVSRSDGSPVDGVRWTDGSVTVWTPASVEIVYD